jgi:hypothetical protein
VDTELTENDRARTDAVLRRADIEAAEAQAIRSQVEPSIIAYNALHWDWFHLGLCDLLDALVVGFGATTRQSNPELEQLYQWAMAIANRGRET